MQVNIVEAKNWLSQIIQSALSGEEVVIANRRGRYHTAEIGFFGYTLFDRWWLR